jgi:Zn-dependent oligopeptidase
MTTPTSNPLLAWLWEGAPAPYPVTAEMLGPALDVAHRQVLTQLRAFLAERPTLAAYRAFQKASSEATSLEIWQDFAGSYSPQREINRMRPLIERHKRRGQRLWNRLSVPKGPYQQHLRFLERRLLKDGEKDWARLVAGERQLDNPAGVSKLNRDMASLARKVERRQNRLGQRHDTLGGLHLKTWPAPAHAAFEEESRKLAAKRGLRGHVILPGSDPDTYLLCHSPEESVRQQLWAHRQTVGVRASEIEQMRELRQPYAEAFGQNDFAAFTASGALISTPTRSERWLGGSLDRLRKPMARALEEGGRRTGLNDAAREPWNFRYALCMGLQFRELAVPETVFPWRATALKIFPELLALGGWRCLGAPMSTGRGTARMLRFRIRHTDGRRAQVWYAPFNPSKAAGSQVGAMAWGVRETLKEDTHIEQVVAIQHFLQEDTEGFSLKEVEYLCHELGHVLHYLALPGLVPNEVSQLTMDYDELPSTLLEIYGRQPETLIRWAGPQAPAAARKPAYWARRLTLTPKQTIDMHRRLYRPYVDLRLNRRHTGPLSKVLEEADARGGFVRHGRQKEELNYFDWSELAASGVSHLTGEALAQRLLPLQEHGQVRSADIAARFQELLDRVLSEGTSGRRLQWAWRQFMGEGIADSTEAGFRSLISRHHRIL